MVKAIGLGMLVGLFLFAGMGVAQEVEFNYEGLVKIDGIPYNGPGYFKFSIVNRQGDVTLWSNDGTVAGGVEPATAVSVGVLDGVFNVIIGDASMANMEPLVASIFNAKEKVFLRVWFCDSLAGPYEWLLPDRAIANPALLGSQLFSELDLYVDPVLGDDKYPGNHPAHPKRTIQAAWDALPPMISESVNIHLAEGIYREDVLLTGKTMIGDATIYIIGNTSQPGNVRMTGANEGAETTPVRANGIRIVDQNRLSLAGIRVDYVTEYGVYGYESKFTMTDCILSNCKSGVFLEYCRFRCANVLSENNSNSGLVMEIATNFEVSYTTSRNNGNKGLGANRQSSGVVTGCTFDNNGQGGVALAHLSSIIFENNQPKTTISNSPKGLWASYGAYAIAVVTGTQNVIFSNNTIDRYTDHGGQIQ